MGRLDTTLSLLNKLVVKTKEYGAAMSSNMLKTGKNVASFNSALAKAVATTQDLTRASARYQQALRETEALVKKIQNATKAQAEQHRAAYNKAVANERALKQAMLETERVLVKKKGTLAQLSAQIALNNAKIRESIDFTRKLTREERALIRETGRLEQRLRRYSATARRATTSTNMLSASFRKSVGGIMLFSQGFIGVTIAIYGAIRLIRNFIGIVRDFGKEAGTLAGVLGVARSEIEGMSDAAVVLSTSLPLTTIEVTQLQTTLARLGYTMGQIQALAPSVAKATIAWGSEVGQTAELIGAVIKAYDTLDSSNIVEITDKLAATANNSALSFEKMRIAIPFAIGSVAQAGVEFDDFLTILGLVNNQLISGSRTGTSIGQMFVQLSKEGMTLNEAMKQMSETQDVFATALDLTNVRGARALIALHNQRSEYEELNGAVVQANGTIDILVNERLKTLDGSLNQVTASWTAYVTALRGSEGTLKMVSDWWGRVLKQMTLLVTAEKQLAAFGLTEYDMSLAGGGLGAIEQGQLLVWMNRLYAQRIVLEGKSNVELTKIHNNLLEHLDATNEMEGGYERLQATMLRSMLDYINELVIANIEAKELAETMGGLGEGEAVETSVPQQGIISYLKEQVKTLGEGLEVATTTEGINKIVEQIARLKVIIEDLSTVDPDAVVESWDDMLARMEERAQKALDKLKKITDDAAKARLEMFGLEEEESVEGPGIDISHLTNEIQGLTALFKMGAISGTEYNAIIEGLVDSYGKLSKAVDTARTIEPMLQAMDFAKQALLDEESFAAASYDRKLELLAKALDYDLTLKEEHAAAVRALQAVEAKVQEELVQSYLTGYSQLAQGMGDAGKALSKDAETQKTIATAQATILAFLGAARAATTYAANPVLSAIMAAAQLAIGLAQVARIQNTDVPSYAKGTEYLDRGVAPRGTDTISIMANEGERIVPTHLNRMLMGVSNDALPGLVHMGVSYRDGQLSMMKSHLHEAKRTNRLLQGLQWQDHDGSYVDLEGNRKTYTN